jgi:curved DNA-binding protein CbpA
MDTTKNYYRTLGVLPTAELIVIKAAYRALATKYHPDKWTGDKSTAHQKMLEMNEAYEVLSDTQAREQYDKVRKKKEFDEYEFEDEATEDAFRSEEVAQRSDWDVAVDYYPDLNTIYTDLKRTSYQLAFAFRQTMLETKQFPKAKKAADDLEASFLKIYFGNNPQLLTFARKLIQDGHKDAAKELNRAISVLGTGADADLIISRLQKTFFADRTSVQEAAEKFSREHKYHRLYGLYSSHDVKRAAIEFIEKLGGTVTYEQELSRALFWRTIIVVSLEGECRRFKREYDMMEWVRRSVVPKVLSR